MSELPIAEVETSDDFSLPSIAAFTTHAQQADPSKQGLNLENIITRKTVALLGGFSALHAPFFSQPGLLQQIISNKPAQLVVYYFSLQEEEVFRFEQFCHLYLDIPVVLVPLSIEKSIEDVPQIDTLCIDDNGFLETIPMLVLQKILSFQNTKDSCLIIGLSQWNASWNVHIRAINSMNSHSQKPSIMPVLSTHALPPWLRFYCDTFDSIQLGVFSHHGELDFFDELEPSLKLPDSHSPPVIVFQQRNQYYHRDDNPKPRHLISLIDTHQKFQREHTPFDTGQTFSTKLQEIRKHIGKMKIELEEEKEKNTKLLYALFMLAQKKGDTPLHSDLLFRQKDRTESMPLKAELKDQIELQQRLLDEWKLKYQELSLQFEKVTDALLSVHRESQQLRTHVSELISQKCVLEKKNTALQKFSHDISHTQEAYMSKLHNFTEEICKKFLVQEDGKTYSHITAASQKTDLKSGDTEYLLLAFNRLENFLSVVFEKFEESNKRIAELQYENQKFERSLAFEISKKEAIKMQCVRLAQDYGTIIEERDSYEERMITMQDWNSLMQARIKEMRNAMLLLEVEMNEKNRIFEEQKSELIQKLRVLELSYLSFYETKKRLLGYIETLRKQRSC